MSAETTKTSLTGTADLRPHRLRSFTRVLAVVGLATGIFALVLSWTGVSIATDGATTWMMAACVGLPIVAHTVAGRLQSRALTKE